MVPTLQGFDAPAPVHATLALARGMLSLRTQKTKIMVGAGRAPETSGSRLGHTHVVLGIVLPRRSHVFLRLRRSVSENVAGTYFPVASCIQSKGICISRCCRWRSRLGPVQRNSSHQAQNCPRLLGLGMLLKWSSNVQNDVSVFVLRALMKRSWSGLGTRLERCRGAPGKSDLYIVWARTILT